MAYWAVNTPRAAAGMHAYNILFWNAMLSFEKCSPFLIEVNHPMAPAVMPNDWISILVARACVAVMSSVEKNGMKTMPPPAPVELATIAPISPTIKKCQ